MITWKDLFDFDSATSETKKAVGEINRLDEAYKRWIKGMQQNKADLSNAVIAMTKQLETLSVTLKKVNPDTEENRKAIAKASTEVQVAAAKYDALNKKIAEQQAQIKKLQGEQKQISKTRESANQKMTEQEKLQERLKKAYSDENKEVVKLKIQIAEKNRQVTKEIKETLKSADAYEKLKQNTNNAQLQFKRMAATYGTNSKQAKEAQKEFNKFDKELRNINSAANDGRRDVGRYGTAFDGLKGMIGQAGMAMKAFIANPVVAVIAGIVGALALMRKALTRSEEGQDRLNKIMTIAGSVIDNIMDVVTDFAITIVDAFKNPKQAIMDFGQSIVDNILNRFVAIGEIGSIIGDVIQSLFNREFSKAKEQASQLGGKLIQVATGLDDIQRSKAADTFKKIGDEIKTDTQRASELADEQARYNKLEREFLVKNEQLRSLSAKKRADAEETKRTDTEESLKLLKEAFDLDEQVLENEKELQELRVKNLKLKSSMAADDIDAKKEIAEAEAELFRIETKFDEMRRQRTRRLNSTRDEALKQEREITKAEIDIAKSRAEEEIKNNEIIIKSTRTTLEQKEQAIRDNLAIQSSFLAQETDLELQELESRKNLKLITEENYAAQRNAITAKRVSDEKKMEAQAYEELADIKQEHQENSIAIEELKVSKLIRIAEDQDRIVAINEEQQNQILDAKIAAVEAQKELELRKAEQEITDLELLEAEKQRIIEESNRSIEDIQAESMARMQEMRFEQIDNVLNYGQQVSAFFEGMFARADQKDAERMQALDQRREQEVEAAGNNAELKKQIEQKFDKEKEKIEKKAGQRQRLIAIAQKAFDIARIVSDTQRAATAALLPPPFGAGPIAGLALQPAIIGRGVLSAAIVAAQPIPQYKDGTESHSGGLAIVGDGGRAEVISDKRGGAWITPDKPTLMDIPKGYQVFDSIISAQKGLGDIDINRKANDGLIGARAMQPLNDRRITRGLEKVVKAIESRPEQIWGVSHGRLSSTMRKGHMTYLDWDRKNSF